MPVWGANKRLFGQSNPRLKRTLGRWCPSSSTPSSSTTCLVPPHGAGVHSLKDSLMTADSSGRRLRSDAEKGRPGLSPAGHTGCCNTSRCFPLTLTQTTTQLPVITPYELGYLSIRTSLAGFPQRLGSMLESPETQPPHCGRAGLACPHELAGSQVCLGCLHDPQRGTQELACLEYLDDQQHSTRDLAPAAASPASCSSAYSWSCTSGWDACRQHRATEVLLPPRLTLHADAHARIIMQWLLGS